MRIKVFSSGSDGNSTLVVINEKNIIIDAGISKKELDYNLSNEGISFDDIDYVFISHGHIDHIKCLSSLFKIKKAKIILSLETFKYLEGYYSKKPLILKSITEKLRENNIIIVEKNNEDIFYPCLEFDSFNVQILPLFHDIKGTIGFVFYEDKKKMTYITDTGYVHQDIIPYIYDSNIIILESNHDPELLMASDRPFLLKKRIASNEGHLSNEQSMLCLVDSIGKNTKYVLHAHVSKECNLHLLIENKRKEVFDAYNIIDDNIEYTILGTYPSKEFII